MASRVTAVVFASPNMSIVHDESDQRRVVATGHVSAGDLLLVEELVAGEPSFVKLAVAMDQNLFRVLHPRREDDMIDALDARTLMRRVQEKLDKNSWGQRPSFLGSRASAFNHCCSPNAMFCIIPVHQEGGGFAVVYAGEHIAPGREITISYGTEVGHGHPAFPEIHCGGPPSTCTKENRHQYFRRMSDMARAWLADDPHGIKSKLLPRYAETDEAKDVYEAHQRCHRMLRKRCRG